MKNRFLGRLMMAATLLLAGTGIALANSQDADITRTSHTSSGCTRAIPFGTT